MSFLWPLSVRISCPVDTSQIRMLLSSFPEASQRPSGLNAASITDLREVVRSRTARPVMTSHSRTVLSSTPEASQRPSGLKAIEYTQVLPRAPKGLSLASVRISRPVVASQRVTMLLEFSAASQCPSRLKASACTSLVFFPTVLSSCPVGTSQNLTVRSQLPEARRRPSELNATPVTQLEWPWSVRSSTKSGGTVLTDLLDTGTTEVAASIAVFTGRACSSKGSSLTSSVAGEDRGPMSASLASATGSFKSCESATGSCAGQEETSDATPRRCAFDSREAAMASFSSSTRDEGIDIADKGRFERLRPRGLTASSAAASRGLDADASRFAEPEASRAGLSEDVLIVKGRDAPNKKKNKKKNRTTRKERDAARPRDISSAVECPAEGCELLGNAAEPADPRSTGRRGGSARRSRGSLGSLGNQFVLTD